MRFTKLKLGGTVALTQCEANPFIDGMEMACAVRISGLFTIEEHVPFEPSNYQWEDGFNVACEREGEALWFYVSTTNLVEQVDPSLAGMILFDERQQEFYEEDRGALEAPLTFSTSKE